MTATITEGLRTDEAAFLRAICENPEDDLPRLVFADWLEEHGETEQAEMIRRMIATGEEDVTALRDDGTWATFITQEQMRDVKPIDLRWMSGDIGISIGVFKRGFLEALYCSESAWRGSSTGKFIKGVFHRDNPGFMDQFHRLPIMKVVLRGSIGINYDLARQGREGAGLRKMELPFLDSNLW